MNVQRKSIASGIQEEIESLPPELEGMCDELERTPEDVVREMMDMVVYQLSRRMKELGWSQTDLAKAMAVSPPLVNRLLHASNTSLLTIARAAHALELSFQVLKFVPEDEAEEQIDEIKPFVQTEATSGAWWPATRCEPPVTSNRVTPA